MITFQNHIFLLENRFLRYAAGVDAENKLYHIGLLPADRLWDRDAGQRDRLKYPYPFEALVNTGFEGLQCSHGVRAFWSLSAYRAVYASHRIDLAGPEERLVITLLDETAGIRIHLHYVLHENSPAIRRYTGVENIGTAPVVVDHIASFVLGNFPYYSGPEDRNDLHLHRFKSHWSWEGSHETVSFDELGLYKAWCRNGYVIENNSTWVCQQYLPYFVLEERESSLFWGVQLEYSGPWRFEAGSADAGDRNWFYCQGGMGNDRGAQWHKTLAPGETFEGPPCSLTAGDSLQEVYNRMHTHQSRVLIRRSPADEALPVIYNDWQFMHGEVSEGKILEQLEPLRTCGIDCYVVDAGWFCAADKSDPRSDWWRTPGDWEFDPVRFPRGPAFLAGEIARRGMIPGLWCEIEAVGPLSALYQRDRLLMKRGERFVEDVNRRFLYFGDEGGRAYADSVFDRLIGYGFRYFKIDYNIDSAPGCTNAGDSLGQGLHAHRTGYYRWLEALRARHPDVILENCSSGGMRLEYGMLSRTDLASITDQESNRHTGQILYQVTKCIHPSQCGNWSALRADLSPEEYAFTLAGSMMGRMHVSGDIARHEPWQRTLLAEAIRFYKGVRELIRDPVITYHTGDVPFHDPDGCVLYEYRDRENSRAVVNATRLTGSRTDFRVRFPGMRPGQYTVTRFPAAEPQTLSAVALAQTGLDIRLERPYTAALLSIERA